MTNSFKAHLTFDNHFSLNKDYEEIKINEFH